MNATATATTIRYLACNACSIALTDAEVPVDPKVEEKFHETGRLFMGEVLELKRQCPCYFCGNKTDRPIQWKRY